MCNSSFTKRTLVEAGVDTRKIEVLPLAFPPTDSSHAPGEGPVIFLNAGTQSATKGLHLLYRAWRELKFRETDAELWLVGKMVLPEALRRDLPGRVRIMNSLPHTELMQLYSQAAVFVLPSLADGFGMVVTEALSRGLPAIVSTTTGAADLIEHGKTGFVIPPQDEHALQEQMRWCVEHRDRLPIMGREAADRAARWQWDDYRRSFAAVIRRRLRDARDVIGHARTG
jgi:glycosyltransferase involved in cell wall biosynthesis